ncbi:MAG: hypothetical protein KBD78_06445 [Oligoflexales bacterium]|nr:hypothetical protein [Oligoflexales bacterium]
MINIFKHSQLNQTYFGKFLVYFTFFGAFYGTNACNDKVEAHRLRPNKQQQSQVELPKSNSTDSPFFLNDSRKISSYSGNILLWKEGFTKTPLKEIKTPSGEFIKGYYYQDWDFEANKTILVTSEPANAGAALSKLAILKRQKEALLIAAIYERDAKQKKTSADLDRLNSELLSYDSNTLANQRTARLEAARTWFTDLLTSLPVELQNEASITDIKTRFNNYCEAQIFSLATNKDFFLNTYFTERPSPEPLCEAVYEELGLISAETAECAPSENPRDYYRCLWHEGVAKTNIFKSSYTPAVQASLIAWIDGTMVAGSNSNIREMLNKDTTGQNRTTLLKGNQKIDGYCCFIPVDQIDESGKKFRRPSPWDYLDTNLNDPFINNLGIRNKKYHIFGFIFDGITSEQLSQEDQENIRTKYAAFVDASLFLGLMSNRIGSASVYDSQVNAAIAYVKKGSELSLWSKNDLDLTARNNLETNEKFALQNYPSAFPSDTKEVAQAKAKLTKQIAAINHTQSKITAEFNAKYDAPLLSIVEAQATIVLQRKDNYNGIYDTNIDIAKTNTGFDYRIQFMQDADRPWVQVCFEIDDPSAYVTKCDQAQVNMRQNVFTDVKYNQSSGELSLSTTIDDLGKLGLEPIILSDDNQSDKQFSLLGEKELLGNRLELILVENTIRKPVYNFEASVIEKKDFYLEQDVLSVITGSVIIWGKNNKELYKGSLNVTNANQLITSSR